MATLILRKLYSLVKISVIIPVINEVDRIASAIDRAWDCGADEVLVVDGGSTDGSLAVAEHANCILVTADIGRGTQQNAGAREATGQVLLFLHADIWLEANVCQQIRNRFESAELFCGGFLQQIEAANTIYRWIERGNALRVRWRGLLYGDQAIFVSRPLFDSVNGFPNEPLMEDFILAQKLKRRMQPVLLPGPVHDDARRWQSNGPIRQTIRNWWIVTLFYFGVSPKRLNRLYHRHDQYSRRDPFPANAGQRGVLK